MKILYIYRDYKGRRKKYGELMEGFGNKVKYVKIKHKKEKNQIPESCVNKKIDLVWFQNIFYIKNNPSLINCIKSLGIPICSYFTFNPQESYTEKKWMNVWKKIDYFFVQNKIFYDFLKKNNCNAYYMPLAFYPDQYYKTINNKKYDISFCGTDLIRETKDVDKRARYIQSLQKYNIAVYGDGFKNKVEGIPVFSYKTHSKQRNVYGKTKINLDLPFFCTPGEIYRKGNNRYHFKNRFFEVPATGNFLLTVRCPEFLDIFPEDVVGYYDDDIESLKENVKRYLKDEKLRNEMAKKAYKLVHQKHTYLHRFKEMFKIIKK
ncbi:hypothetical protein LCGC14_1322220 [marine sediment metagenome]|uniref:Spore protein YkvP/CgeB glycosyl transferase-like domain-containing protein n=1 Tax=marine sediment metagenome TaxID=412755 RepID=A0A0F9NLH3_9ZZZZ